MVTSAAGEHRSRWRLRLLGEFELSSGRHVVRLGGLQQRLLAFLVLQRRAVTREVVAASLWAPSPGDGSARLRNAVWRLRKAAPGVLDATRERLRVAASVSVDLDRAQEAARRLSAEPSRPPPREVATLLEHDLLPDWGDDWVVIERERFRRARLHALEVMARALAAAGRFAEASTVAGLAVDAEPLRESAHRASISVSIAEGNWGEALEQYGRCCQILDQELGIGPSPALAALLAPTAATAAGGPRRRPHGRRASGAPVAPV